MPHSPKKPEAPTNALAFLNRRGGARHSAAARRGGQRPKEEEALPPKGPFSKLLKAQEMLWKRGASAAKGNPLLNMLKAYERRLAEAGHAATGLDAPAAGDAATSLSAAAAGPLAAPANQPPANQPLRPQGTPRQQDTGHAATGLDAPAAGDAATSLSAAARNFALRQQTSRQKTSRHQTRAASSKEGLSMAKKTPPLIPQSHTLCLRPEGSKSAEARSAEAQNTVAGGAASIPAAPCSAAPRAAASRAAALPEGLKAFSYKNFLMGETEAGRAVKEKIERLLRESLEGFPSDALHCGGLILVLEKSLSQPLEIQTPRCPSSLPFRLLIFIEDNAKADIIETPIDGDSDGGGTGARAAMALSPPSQQIRTGLPPSFFHMQTHIFIGRGAKLSHIRIHKEEGGFAFNSLSADLDEGAEARFLTVDAGAEQIRYETSLRQRKSSLSYIHGLSICFGKSLSSQSLCARLQDRAALSRQFSKSFVFDSAKHIFEGRIFIEKKAAKAVASQMSHNTLLGPKAKAFSSPELDVRADDVEARHGAATSSLKESAEALFYLQSRGISPQEALLLLCRAGLEKALAPFPLKNALLPLVSRKLKEKISCML